MRDLQAALFWIAALPAAVAAGDVIHIPADQPTLQAAVAAAVDGDEIILADGIYTGAGNRNITIDSKAITIRSANGAGSCVIDCQRSGRAFVLTGLVFSDTVLEGLTIRNGLATDSAVSDAQTSGGAIVCDGNDINITPVIRDCVLAENTATLGGAIHALDRAAPLIERCTFINNQAELGAAFALTGFGFPQFFACGFFANHSAGGAAYSAGDNDPLFINCVFAGHTGPALYEAPGSELALLHCTIANGIGRNAIGVYKDALSDLYATHSIIRGHEGGSIVSALDGARNISDNEVVTHCNIEGGFEGVGNIDADALFVEPAGLDEVIGTADDNLRLGHGSTSIDAGNNDLVPGDITTDFDGNPRVVDGDGAAPAIVDMGAFEHQPADINGDGIVNGYDLALLLGQWSRCPRRGLCPADLDGNGLINGLDLAMLLAAWSS